jgi:protein-L-isoaspartate(D-aspartate) O-methyltransferase
MRWKDFRIARERMVREQLFERGIRDRGVLQAMLRIPRHVFLDDDSGSEAYSDHSFPIGYSQTMSQPYMVGFLCQALQLGGDECILEIGTGSGYQAAILASNACQVYTVERVPELAQRARERLHDLLLTNVTVLTGDGASGWREYAPYDRILLTAAARKVPTSLLTQLTDGGILVGPVEKADGGQEVVRLTRRGDTCHLERLGACTFVPMVRDSSGPDDEEVPAEADDQENASDDIGASEAGEHRTEHYGR